MWAEGGSSKLHPGGVAREVIKNTGSLAGPAGRTMTCVFAGLLLNTAETFSGVEDPSADVSSDVRTRRNELNREVSFQL